MVHGLDGAAADVASGLSDGTGAEAGAGPYGCAPISKGAPMMATSGERRFSSDRGR